MPMGQNFLGYWLVHKIHSESCRKLLFMCVFSVPLHAFKTSSHTGSPSRIVSPLMTIGPHVTGIVKGRSKNSFVHKCLVVEKRHG